MIEFLFGNQSTLMSTAVARWGNGIYFTNAKISFIVSDYKPNQGKTNTEESTPSASTGWAKASVINV